MRNQESFLDPCGPFSIATTTFFILALIWRQAVRLRIAEIAELIGVSAWSVSLAKGSAEPSSQLLAGMQLLQERLLAGQLDTRPLIRGPMPQGRSKKIGQPPGKTRQKKPDNDVK
jgi:hypothetical protein